MKPARGILCKLLAVLMFVLMAALIKTTSTDIPPGEAVFFRSIFALPVIFIWLLVRGDLRTGLRVVSPTGHFLRGFAGTTAMALFFASLGLLPLPEVTALSYAAPLFNSCICSHVLG
jgi:drug/metabolite transporter (DMT)-like permease